LFGSFVSGLVQGLFQEPSRLEMSLAPGWHVDNLASTGVSGRWLWPRVLDLKHAKTSNFYAIALNETIAHGHKKAVDHLGSQVFFTPSALTNEEG